MAERIGLIGVGLLGSAIAARLLKQGFRVLGHDPRPEPLTELTAAGGDRAGSPVEVAAECRRTILSLPDSSVVSEVIGCLLPSLAPGAVLIDTTTGDPESTQQCGARVGEIGAEYLDATVLGSSSLMRSGEALLMVGGTEGVFREQRDLWEVLGKRHFHLGPVGSGSRMKLVVNLVLGLNRAVLAEGLNLAQRSGLGGQQALEILRSGAAYSAVMDSKGDRMLQGDFAPQARLQQHRKDVGLITQMADQEGVPVPLTELHATLLDHAIRLGFGDCDNSAIIRAFE